MADERSAAAGQRLFRGERAPDDRLDAEEALRDRPAAELSGYTLGMKTAVSIPDEIFEKVERLAERERQSRSEVYSAALRDYVARHAPDEVTEAMNRVCDQVGAEPDEFLVAAARRVLERVEW